MILNTEQITILTDKVFNRWLQKADIELLCSLTDLLYYFIVFD